MNEKTSKTRVTLIHIINIILCIEHLLKRLNGQKKGLHMYPLKLLLSKKNLVASSKDSMKCGNEINILYSHN